MGNSVLLKINDSCQWSKSTCFMFLTFVRVFMEIIKMVNSKLLCLLQKGTSDVTTFILLIYTFQLRLKVNTHNILSIHICWSEIISYNIMLVTCGWCFQPEQHFSLHFHTKAKSSFDLKNCKIYTNTPVEDEGCQYDCLKKCNYFLHTFGICFLQNTWFH